MWQRIFALVVKEILTLLRDPRSRFVVIVPPLIQLFVFSYAATQDVTSIRLAVLDESRTAESRALLARFTGAPVFTELLPAASAVELHDLIERNAADAALHIGPGFATELHARPPASVSLLLDGRMSNTAQIIQSYAANILLDFGTEWSATHGGLSLPSTMVPRIWFNPNSESIWAVVPGLVGLLTMVVALVVTSLSIARERELGTFEQLMVTPLRPVEILVGKTTPALIIGLFEASVIVLAARFWFQVPLTGSLALLYGALLLFLLAIIGVGLFISSLVRTQQQAILGAFLFLVPAVVLSGFATPVENMPEWLQTATWVNPLRHMIVILRGVFLKDMQLGVAFEDLWPMALIAAVTLGSATWLFRRRMF